MNGTSATQGLVTPASPESHRPDDKLLAIMQTIMQSTLLSQPMELSNFQEHKLQQHILLLRQNQTQLCHQLHEYVESCNARLALALEEEKVSTVMFNRLVSSHRTVLIRGSAVCSSVEPTKIVDTCAMMFEATSQHVGFREMQERMRNNSLVY